MARSTLERRLRRTLRPVVQPPVEALRRLSVPLGLRLAARWPSPVSLGLLRRLYGNVQWAPERDYLKTIAAEVTAREPAVVLECGSGLTTLLLGALARRRRFAVIALEDDPTWATTIRERAARFGLDSVTVVDAPIADRDGYQWYAPPPSSLPAHVDLVVCDGPPSTVKSGRYGVVPALHDRLRDAVILLDDANRRGEQATLDRWRNEFGATVAFVPGSSRGLARVTLPVVPAMPRSS